MPHMPRILNTRSTVVSSAVLSGLLLSACASDAISPWEPMRWEQSSVTVVSSGRSAVDSNSEKPSVGVFGRRVELRGLIGTPDLCVELDVDATTFTQVMEVDIVVRRPPHSGCATVFGVFEYVAAATHRSGTYRLRVAHRYPAAGDNPRRVVLDTIITIP